MKKILLLLGLVSLNVFAQLRNVQRAEIPFKNWVLNGGGEQSTANWAVTAGTLASETTTVHSGLGSISFNPSASTQALSSTLVAIPAGNGACLAEFYYYGFGTADMRIYVKDNSANVIGGYTAADTSWAISTAVTAWTRVQVPFACPVSGTTVQLVLEAQGDAAIGYIDDVYLGRDFRVGSDMSPELTLTATRITSVQTIGSLSQTTVIYNSAPIDKYAEFNASTGVFTAKKAGRVFVSAGVAYQNHTSERSIVTIQKSGADMCLAANAIDSSNVTVNPSCAFDIVVGDTINVTADSVTDTSYDVLTGAGSYLNITRYPANSETIMRGDTTDLSGWATTAGVTSCQWSTTSASMAAFAADTDCGAPTLLGNATAPATKIPGIIVPNIIPGRYRVTAIGNFTQNTESSSGSQNCGFEIYDGTNEGPKVNMFQLVSKGVGATSIVEAEFEYTTKKTNTQFEVRAIRQSGNANCVISNDGSSYADFRIGITPLSQSIPRPFVQSSVFAGRLPVVKIGTGVVLCSSSAAITTNTDSMISSIANIASGACAITLATGYFTTTPQCFATWTGGGNNSITYSAPSSATATTVGGISDAGTNITTASFQITCFGNN